MAVSAYYWALRFKEQKQQLGSELVVGFLYILRPPAFILPELTMASLTSYICIVPGPEPAY